MGYLKSLAFANVIHSGEWEEINNNNNNNTNNNFYWRYNPLWVCILQPSSRAITSSRTRFLDHTQRRATIGRTPLDEWSVRRRDLYLTTQNIHNRQTSMPPVGFDPTISAGERPKKLLNLQNQSPIHYYSVSLTSVFTYSRQNLENNVIFIIGIPYGLIDNKCTD